MIRFLLPCMLDLGIGQVHRQFHAPINHRIRYLELLAAPHCMFLSDAAHWILRALPITVHVPAHIQE